MHTPTPYEVTIAAKLEQLPVSDMMDSIWASIELQLDADLSSEDDEKSPSQNPAKGIPGMSKGLYWSVVAAVIIAIVLIYKASKNDKKKNNNTPAPAKKEIVVPNTDSNRNTNIRLEKNANIAPVANKKDNTINPFIPGNRISFDSVNQQLLPFNKTDSSATIKNKPLLPSFDSMPPPPLIKPKGVKGITDNDYRIQESKKDSGKKAE